MLDSLPASRGSYALLFMIPRPIPLNIGQLGDILFPAGAYIYLGSANGPGGLKARLGRHLQGCEKHRWHIDYLRTAAEVQDYCYLVLETGTNNIGKPLECCWSQALASIPGAWIPMPGFGASDCRSACPAHLVAMGVAGPVHIPRLILAKSAGVPVEAILPGG